MINDSITLYSPIVRTDLSVYSCGRVVVGSRIVRLLNARVRDAVTLIKKGDEILMGVERPADGVSYCGLLRSVSAKSRSLQLQSVELARTLLCGAPFGKYRCGELVTHCGRTYMTVITRRNYANQADRADGDKPKPR